MIFGFWLMLITVIALLNVFCKSLFAAVAAPTPTSLKCKDIGGNNLVFMEESFSTTELG